MRVTVRYAARARYAEEHARRGIRAAIVGRLAMLTGRLADGLSAADVTLLPTRLRAPHILSLSFPKGLPKGLIERLAAESIYVAPRLGRMRISPHVYNDEADIDRFTQAFRRLVA